MFLKRLTMKGFKSFADNTVLEFEPGVTAVVGPNGSGKSNVVDAVTWVLGAQSTRALRSARMDDVIFAGTASRSALGRAEVSLTLDNASDRLPVDGAEVTISRTLFRNGDSEYAINGTVCRLLDVQELLADSGVGRQQHMIIGQGQLDSILNSSSESRRAVIEEAAGVLKHRRRKERAERRLAQTQENLERLGDLVREVRRQMRPLERQAASARTYAEVDRELRAARAALFVERLDAFDARRRVLESSLTELNRGEEATRRQLVALDAQATSAAAEMASRREELLASALGDLQGLSERARGRASLIAERERLVRAALDASADENVIATLEADAARLASDLEALESDDARARDERAALAADRRDLEVASAAHEATWAGASFEADEERHRSATARAADLARELGRAREAVERVEARTVEIATRRAGLERDLAEAAAETLRRTHERDGARGALGEAEERSLRAEAELARVRDELARATDASSRAQARAEALERALEEISGSDARQLLEEVTGVLGAVVDLIEVDEGAERAVESAAGAAVGATLVDGPDAARRAVALLRRDGAGGVVLPVVDPAPAAAEVPTGCRAVRSMVRARAGSPRHVERALDALFHHAVMAPSWEEALEVALTHPDLVVVTPDGDRFAPTGWRSASGRAVVTRAAVDEARERARVADAVLPTLRETLASATREAGDAARALRDAAASERAAVVALEQEQRDAARLAQRRNEIDAQEAALATEAERATQAHSARAAELAEVERLVQELAVLVTGATERRAERDAAATELARWRQRVTVAAEQSARRDAELAERRRLLEVRRDEIERRLEGHGAERAAAAARREQLEADLAALARLATVVSRVADDVATAQGAFESSYREQLEASRAGAERLEALRRERHDLEQRLDALADERRRADVEIAELAVKRAGVLESVHRDLGIEPEALVAEPVELPEGVGLAERVGELEARVTSLGPINPLALEELAALEDRYRDLDAQVSDVRVARRELQEALHELDDEIMRTFSAAVADVNEHFATLIAMLFPGGQGRLILTEPDDPLNTGVEIEVRPMGRNVRRISLLSGGERSMAALAFLFAVFRSRPSPFYMMDEVEAALDDVNLQRFLSLIDEFRDEAQLLIVTHQKRTMESADALYGVTMVPGGSSKVVSQRVRREVVA